MGGGGITPISVTPIESCMSPLCCPCPLGVTRSLGSMERGLTASFTANYTISFTILGLEIYTELLFYMQQ